MSAALPISIREVSKAYGRLTVLDRVSLEIESGEFITLLGPSGSGKTTLLMVMAGFVRPDSGSLLFGNREVVLTPPHKRDVGMVFQNYALFPHMTVAGNIGYPLKLRGVGRTEIEERVTRVLDLVRLSGLGERQVDQLSGGQRQRVALARAIVFEPRILLMDEPLSALDKKLREQMQIEVKHLHQRLGMTTVYVTHDQREALTMSDRIAVIDRGRFAQIGAPREIYDRPASRFVADFIGESFFLPISMNGHGPMLGPVRLKTTAPVGRSTAQLLAIRPEKLRVLGSEPAPDLNIIEARVREIVYQGESSLAYLTLAAGGELAMRWTGAAAVPNPGEPIRLGLAPEDTILVPVEER